MFAARGGFQRSGEPVFQYFTSTDTWTAPAGVTSVELLLVGGGGAGGGVNQGAGGGGGGLVYNTAVTVSPGVTYTFTIGAGGASPGRTAAGTLGGNSSMTATSGFSNIIAIGGGTGMGEPNGGSPASAWNAQPGGSGGGGCHGGDNSLPDATGVPGGSGSQPGSASGGYGNAGGWGGANFSGSAYNLTGGGGGGAGNVGGNVSSFGTSGTITTGAQGIGWNSNPYFANTSLGDQGYFAGGGTGGAREFGALSFIAGGVYNGGGGHINQVSTYSGSSYPGQTNTGGGGGGAWMVGNFNNDIRGGAGGSGFGLIKYIA
jgi:hypothetical protein